LVLGALARCAARRRRPLTFTPLLAVLTLVSLAHAPLATGADESPSVSTTDAPLVKAAIIYNICKFVEWPTNAANGGDFLIGTVAAQENGPALATLAGKKIHGRTVRIVEIKDEAALASCQAVYLGHAGLDADTLSHLAGKPILTFTEAAREGARPGAIDLTTDGARIRFSIHRGISERAGLRLSSQLLKLALSVTED
jgi:hypothetical protein